MEDDNFIMSPASTSEHMERCPFPSVESDEDYRFNSSSDHTPGYSEDSSGTPTVSVGSSVFSFTYSNGRRYHSDRFKSADYFMPNDESEQERLDMYHHIFLLLLNGELFTAPLEKEKVRRVLDAGTGTGIWAIDFADLFPGAQVIGTDISPIQPTWVPANCKFEVDDMEEEWIFPRGYFDYIHMRSLSGAIKDWPNLMKQSYDALAPGAYIEFQDYSCEIFLSDGTRIDDHNPKYKLASWFLHVTRASDKQGRLLNVGPKAQEFMEKAGFVDVVAKSEVWPLGEWPKDPRLKELGRWGKLGAHESGYPFALQLLTREGWTPEQVKELVDNGVSTIRKGGPKYYVLVWFVYGRKPLNE